MWASPSLLTTVTDHRGKHVVVVNETLHLVGKWKFQKDLENDISVSE